MAKDLPRDVDLTIKMDFNVKEPSIRSIKLPKEVKDRSYKRYHKYKKSPSETTYSGFTSGFIPSVRGTSTTATLSNIFDNLYRDTIDVEERVCWRELFRDPDIFGEKPMTEGEAIDHIKNLNFPTGSKHDRLKAKLRVEEMKKEFCGGYYCDCCGKQINRRNCLSHVDTLCESCNRQMTEAIRVARL